MYEYPSARMHLLAASLLDQRSIRRIQSQNLPGGVLNSGLIGLAVLALAQLELVRLRRWEEIAQLACGIYLSASPFIFQYAHQHHLRLWHWVLGATVAILALFELWQDWNRPDITGYR